MIVDTKLLNSSRIVARLNAVVLELLVWASNASEDLFFADDPPAACPPHTHTVRKVPSIC